MDAIELLKKYKKRVEPQLKKYFDAKIRKVGTIDPIAKEAVKMIADFTLSDGKRIRPAIVYYSYLAAGGKDDDKIVEASMCIEIIHSFLLIHDDIIDKDDMRHGVETLHTRYRKISKKLSPKKKESEHFGNSMAMIAGDMAATMGNEILFNSKFPPEIIIKALDKLQDIIYLTIPGEMLDVVLEIKGKATEKEILLMHEGKTSRYTFEGPSHLGATLAGAGKEIFNDFSKYSLPLGKAFQIRDDILGVFGDEKKLGKPVGSDIIEGKQTLLVIKALKNGNQKQRKTINSLLGKKNLTKEELEIFRTVVEETGSLDYSNKLAENLVWESLKALDRIDFKNQESEMFFKGIANYIIDRQN